MIYCVYFSEMWEPDWGHKYFKYKHNAEIYLARENDALQSRHFISVELEEICLEDEEEE